MKKTVRFIKVEKVIFASEQLTWHEKRLYTALKMFRHNNPLARCDPSMPTLRKITRLNDTHIRRAKRLLILKGLVECRLGSGRGNTNQYFFPLEDGKEADIQRLLAYLKSNKPPPSRGGFTNDKR